MKLTLGFSPCPNDTFIFDALVNKKIDTEDFDFTIIMDDVETLNQQALQTKLDISKISYGVLPLIVNDYTVLNSGGALGKGVGPLLISKLKIESWKLEIENYKIAIPGENTTANLLFSLAFPKAKNKLFKKFNEIEDAVLNNEVNAGVIIHENRFTYQQKGLIKLIDLGEYWQQKTGLPIPLGGIVAKKNLPFEMLDKINVLIRKSVEYAFENHHTNLCDFVKVNSQEMSEAIMRRHIDLYVNNYSFDLGEDGKKAVMKLIEIYQQLHPENNLRKSSIFVDELNE
ncbi:MAG: 1,4-dihydroxy-6-naphthoate synthase [Chitinophagaceae bacterium]